MIMNMWGYWMDVILFERCSLGDLISFKLGSSKASCLSVSCYYRRQTSSESQDHSVNRYHVCSLTQIHSSSS